MYVENILHAKGAAVFTIAATATVAELVEILTTRNIGAVVVLDASGKVAGIVSERDVVRHLARSAEGLMSLEVQALMTRSPVTCRPSDTIDAAMAKMTERRFRHLPVVEDDALIGIVSIGDLVKRKIEHAEQEAGALRDYIAS